jgi:hypothetical protein
MVVVHQALHVAGDVSSAAPRRSRVLGYLWRVAHIFIHGPLGLIYVPAPGESEAGPERRGAPTGSRADAREGEQP